MNNVIIPRIRNILPGIIAHQITGVQPMMSSYGTGKSMFSSFYASMMVKNYNRRYWPHQYTFTGAQRIEWQQAERWCWQNFRGRYWSNSGAKFAFKRSEHALLFGLTWPCVKC